MTIKNLVESKKLRTLDREARDAYLAETYGITPEDFAYIRTDNDGDGIIDRVLRAGERLRGRLFGHVAPDALAAQFTGETLVALIDDGKYSEGNFKQLRSVASVALRRNYKERKLEALRQEHLNIPYTQFLREDLCIYHGNLHDAKRRWPKMQVSNYDWLKDVQIPLVMGELEATLLGVYFARGNLHQEKDRIEIWGENTDFDFYRDYLKNLIKRIHNFEPEVTSGRDKGVVPEGWSYDIPAIVFSSLAIASWLHSEWGLPQKRDKVEVPVPLLETSTQQIGFLKGILAADGRPYVYPDRSRLRIRKSDEVYIESVKRLSEQIGFTPRITKPTGIEKQWELDYSESAMVDMLRMGLFINPHHQELVKPLRASVVELPRNPSLHFSREELRCIAFLYNCHVSAHEIGFYFDFAPNSIGNFLNDAQREGFRIMERRRDHAQLLKDAIKSYDGVIPPVKKPNQP